MSLDDWAAVMGPITNHVERLGISLDDIAKRADDHLESHTLQIERIAIALERIADAQETIAADALEQQAARRDEVRWRYKMILGQRESTQNTGERLDCDEVLADLRERHPWLKDEVQS